LDRKEEILQLKKLAGIDKMVTLLEEIAWQGSHQNVAKEEYLRGLYARSQQSSAEVHGDLRTRPTAR
jgi:CII-binding regulator of phage lambda lysogenization HflD